MTVTDPRASLEDAYRRVVESTGEADRPEMAATPRRAANALVELTSGYRVDIAQVVGDALFESDIDEMVLVGDIELYSLCEHHLLPFTGRCHVAYIPSGRVLGLSKIPELVDVFARRLQIQERLTEQIAGCIEETTGAQGVGVIIEARHLCMLMRGIKKQGSVVTTSAMRGRFRRDPRTRAEFLQLARPGRAS